MSQPSFVVAREALLPALSAASKVVERRNTIPILSNALIEAADDTLWITVNNLDQELTASAPCKAGARVATTIPAVHLADVVRKLPEGAEIAFTIEQANATVAAGRSRFRLPLLPEGDFPRLSGGEFSHRFSLSASSLSRMLAMVHFAMSSEETRYYLCGTYWHAGEGPDGPMLFAVATDGHRLARVALPLPEGVADMPGIIIPRKTVAMLKSLLGDEGEVEIALSAHKILFGIGGTAKLTLTSKLIDGTYPEYTRVVPSGNENQFVASRSALLSAIDRVVTISASRGSAVKHVFLTDGSLRLAASNPDAGEAEDHVEVERVSGDDVEVGFNGRYCLDMLAACPSEKILFELGDPGAPALIRPQAESDGVLFVLMPMRV